MTTTTVHTDQLTTYHEQHQQTTTPFHRPSLQSDADHHQQQPYLLLNRHLHEHAPAAYRGGLVATLGPSPRLVRPTLLRCGGPVLYIQYTTYCMYVVLYCTLYAEPARPSLPSPLAVVDGMGPALETQRDAPTARTRETRVAEGRRR
jgi:hypothetical protein